MNKLNYMNFNKKSHYGLFTKECNKPLILFGASTAGERALGHLDSIGKKVDYFCDNDDSKWGNEFCGIKIISPKQLEKFKKETTILITSIFYDEIKKQLLGMEFKNIYYIYNLGKDKGYYDVEDMLKNKEDINKLYDILSDEKSKFILNNILKFRYFQQYSYMEEICEQNQYFPKDIMSLSSDEIFIDAGSYNGDTIIDFINKVEGNFKKIYAFEPDEANYLLLLKKIKELKVGGKVNIYKKGLSNSTKIVKFTSGYGISSFIDNSGEQVIETIDLDNLLKDEDLKNLYIKMDIEGEEMNALKGAKNIIINKKPKLAICIYHESDHLWKIPLFIKSLVPEYKIFIRHHSDKVFETVCYATI